MEASCRPVVAEAAALSGLADWPRESTLRCATSPHAGVSKRRTDTQFLIHLI